MNTALLAAYTKDDEFLRFAGGLVGLKWNLLASSGTAKFLNDNGIAARDVAEIVGPPILGHRVVTLSREVFAGILAREYDDGDRVELSRIGVHSIGLVHVTLYPLAEELAKPGHTEVSAREKIDIGGPSLLRAAAKGNRIVTCSPNDFGIALTLAALAGNRSVESWKAIARLGAKAERLVSDYSALAAGFYDMVADGKYAT